MVRDKVICMAPSRACHNHLESLFGQFNQVLQDFDNYILEVKGVVLKELQEKEEGQSRDSLPIHNTVKAAKTPGMKKKRKRKIKDTVKLLLDSPNSTIQEDPKSVSQSMNLDDCMTPNRYGTPMMKGKRLRSLLEDHQKTGGRMTRSRAQTGSNISEISTRLTRSIAKQECPITQSVDFEPEDSPYVNSTMLFPGTPKTPFGNITIIEDDSTPRPKVATPMTKEKITRLSSTPANPKSTRFASAEDELIITPILQNSTPCVTTVSHTLVQQPTTTRVTSVEDPVRAFTPGQALPKDMLLKEALIKSNIKSTPKALSRQTPENKLLAQLQKSTAQPSPVPTPSTNLSKLNLINDTLTPPKCGVSSISSTQCTPYQLKFPVIDSTMDEEPVEVPLVVEKGNNMECILEESEVEIRLSEDKADNVLEVLAEEGEEKDEDDKENVEPVNEEDEVVEMLEEEEEKEKEDEEKLEEKQENLQEVSKDLYEEDEDLKEQEVVMEQVKEETTVAAMNTEKEENVNEVVEENEVSEEPEVFVQDSSEDTSTQSEIAHVIEATGHDPVTEVAESIPEEEESVPEEEESVPEEEESVPEEEESVPKEEILEKSAPEKQDVKPRRTRSSAKKSDKKAIPVPEVIEEETVRSTRSSTKKSAKKMDVDAVEVIPESATRITRSSNKKQQPEPELEEEFHTPTQDISTLPRVGTVRKMVERIESPKKEFTLPTKKKQQIPRLNDTVKRDRDTDEESTNSNSLIDESIHLSKKQKGNGGTPRNMKVPPNLVTTMFSMVHRPQDVVVKTAKELEEEKKQAALKRIEEKDAKAQEVLTKKKEKADQLRMARREKEKRIAKARQNREDEARKKKEDMEKKLKLKDAAVAKERDALAKKEEEKRIRENKRAEQALQKRKQDEKVRELKKKQLQEEAQERKEEAIRRKQEFEEKRVRDLERQRQEENTRLEEQRKIEAEELCKRQKAEELRRCKEEEEKRKKEKTPIAHKTKKIISQSGGQSSANTVGHLIQHTSDTPVRPPRVLKGEPKSKIPSKLTKEPEPEPVVKATPSISHIIGSPQRATMPMCVDSPASATSNRLAEYMKNKINKMSTQSCSRMLSINEDSVTPHKAYYSPADNYNINDLETDEDTDDETKPKKPIPKWCKDKSEFRVKLKQQICGETRVKHTALYGPYTMPDLDLLFMTTNKFKARTSSAHWTNAPATGELDFSMLSEEECVRARKIAEAWANK